MFTEYSFCVWYCALHQLINPHSRWMKLPDVEREAQKGHVTSPRLVTLPRRAVILDPEGALSCPGPKPQSFAVEGGPEPSVHHVSKD